MITMSIEHLHQEVERIVTRDSRSNVRVVAHLLIEAGRLTAVECGWSKCIKITRQFLSDTDEAWYPQHPMSVSVDHVVPRGLGGSDRPDNIMLLHLGCNASKGIEDRVRLDSYREKISEASRKRWADPEYRKRVTTKVAERMRDPEVAARKSTAIKKAYENVSSEERIAKAHNGWETRRKRMETK